MANNYSQLAILEGNENCIPVRLGSGRSVDIPAHFFHTKLHPISEVIDHEDKQLLDGIVKHFEAEDLLMGDDGFIYASTRPGDQTLSGDDYEPIALLDGDDLSLAGFKFKMPKFKLPGQKKKSGALIKTRSPLLNKVGNLATKGFRTFTLPGALSKKGIIGRNLKALKNPFKGLKLPKLKFKNPFKGGKGGGGMADALQQFQEMQAQSQSEEMPEEVIEEEAPSDEENYSEETSDYPVKPSGGTEEYSDYSDQGQEDYSTDSTEEIIPDDPGMEQEEYPAEVSGAASQYKTQVANQAFNTANSALSLVPGIGTVASSVLSIGKGLYDANQQDKAAKKQQVSQTRIALLQNLIKKNPQKKVVVKKKPAPKQIAKATAPTTRLSSAPKQLQLTQSSQVAEPSYGTEEKKDNKGLLIGLGIAVAAGIGLAMSGKE